MLLEKDDLPEALKRDLLYLVGRKILELNDLDLGDDKLDEQSSSNLIVQSNLLSGGLQQHLYGYFTKDSLEKMLNDCKFGNNLDLIEHLGGAIKSLEENKFDNQLTEEDKRYRSIIHPGHNKEID